MSERLLETEDPVEYDKLCEDYISLLYEGHSGFISYQPGEKENAEKDKVFLTYGEILYPSFNKVLDQMEVTEDDVFYDFGSGVGKVGLQFLLKTPAKKITGIEANKKRNDVAVKVYAQVKRELPELFKERKFECLQKNFLEVDVSDATIIYTCSTLFDENLLADIGKVVDKCPNIRFLFSIPSVKYDYAHIPCKLPKVKVVEIDCTWDKTKFYVYTLEEISDEGNIEPKRIDLEPGPEAEA